MRYDMYVCVCVCVCVSLCAKGLMENNTSNRLLLLLLFVLNSLVQFSSDIGGCQFSP